jgi:aminotransferase
MRRHPGPVLDFALGRYQDPPPAWLSDFVRESAQAALKRRSDDENDELIDAASRMLHRVFGVSVPATSIQPAPSGRAALSGVVATLVSPGETVLVTEPGYPAFARLASERGAAVEVAALEPDRGFEPNLEALADTPVRLAGLNYPNNPTGTVPSTEVLGRLRETLGPETVIFNDGVYGPLTHDRPPFSILQSVPDGLEMHSLGKLFALGPLGLAFVAGREDLVTRVGRFSDFAWTQVTSLQARTATRCLDDWSHVEGVNDNLRARLDALRDAVTRLGFEPYTVDAGMYLLCRAPREVCGRPVASAGEAADRMLEDHGLAVAPFEVPPHGYLRFSANYLPEDLEALGRLDAALRPVYS